MNVLTIDIGGTFIKYATMSDDGIILSRGKVETPQNSRNDLIETLAGLYRQEEEKFNIDGMAISLPGIIDSENGYVVMGGALRYNDDFYLRHALYQRCPVRIVMENDAKCAVMAEATVGSLKDVRNGFALIFGTMVGGGFVKDRELYRGKHFSAGEVSYIITSRSVDPSIEGVWGNQCSTLSLCNRYARIKGRPVEEVDGIRFFQAVEDGDPDARSCLDKFAHEVAIQIFNIQNVLDPDRFAIGGGISAQPTLIDAIRTNLNRLYAYCPYHVAQAEVVTCKFQNDANLVGALQCYLADVKDGENVETFDTVREAVLPA
ncbi:hypothetical protein CS006_05130 [Bifidobacterium primatium]|uniref:ROK family protein n=1 Tax=Bifidobacterium primatium TaxID=2045438 RepID=A0A2M9H9B5_9BIFI|nr:ROK family protein [Bifidobacterium primatium]PJM73418.1 hypothetical protein CS006_05130 [Bifidobacterium primatium]